MKILKRANRKKLLIVAALIILVAGGVYWIMKSTETGATKSIQVQQTTVSDALKTLNTKLAAKEIASKERVGAFDQLSQVLTQTQAALCKDQKSNVVYNLTKAKEECQASRQKLDEVKTANQNIADSVKDDQALALIMNQAKATDPTDPAKQLEIWTTIVSKLPPLKVSASSIELKNSLITSSTAYKTAWQELITADKEHNKANYEGTIKRLQAVQGTVVKASEQQATQLKTLLGKLKTAMAAYRTMP
ncbi:MAG TPA: hypothetical protein VK497_00265 [Candidatus Saccharimonadales bacterium]|nr:hypothetical protein [Candidatus Saccharimonadales bacterium]